MKKYIKNTLKILLAIVVLGALFFGYKYFQNNVKTTHIAFVNFPDFIYADYSKADDNFFIKTKRFAKKDPLNDVVDYDVVFIFGMGFNPTPEQKENLTKMVEDNTPLFVFIATNPDADLTTLTRKELKEVEKFFKNPNKTNNKNLLNYARKVLDAKKIFTDEVVLAKVYPKNYYFHPTTDEAFEKLSDYKAFYKKQGFYKENKPKVLVLATNLQPTNPAGRHPYFSLMEELEKRNLNVYGATGFTNKLDFIKELAPDLIVFSPHGRLAPGKTKEVEAVLKKLNIPVLGPQTMYEPYEKWLNNQQGLSGGLMSQNIIAPELDGVTTPYVIGAKFPREEDGIMIFKGIPRRITSFSNLIENHLALRFKENKDKKVAIFYYKGPGNNALSSEGMEIVPSLLNVLKHLKEKGYHTGELPKTHQELYARIQKEGKLLGPYAQGSFEKFIKNGNPALIPADTLQLWMQKNLQEQLIADVEKQYGSLPGDYMTVFENNTTNLAVARVQFGNIVLMPQPMPATGDNEFKLIHGVKKATPYPYIGAYLWAREAFKADALMHFGTHGSLEFTPYKQTGLSDLDWSDALIGDKPHFYVYTIGNVGEGMIAKRRSYATLLTHLTPAFDESSFSPELKELRDAYRAYQSVQDNKNLKDQYKAKIKELVLKTKLDKQLNLTISAELTDLQVESISKYLHEVESEKITLGLHTLGQVYEEYKLKNTVKMMSVDPVAYGQATLDVLNGKITEEQKNNADYFDTHYRNKSMLLLDKILNSTDSIHINQYIEQKDLDFLSKWETENPKGNFEEAMAGMMQMFEQISEEETQAIAYNKDRVTELVVGLLANPQNKKAFDRLRDPAQFEKASMLLDRATLKKLEPIAKMVPKLREMLDVMLKPDMYELLEWMQNEDNHKLVLEIMDNPEILKQIKEKEGKYIQKTIDQLLLAQNSRVLFDAVNPQTFLVKINSDDKASLQNKKAVLDFYIEHKQLSEKIKTQNKDEEVVQKILASEKSMASIEKSLVAINQNLERIKETEKTYAKAVSELKEALININTNYNNLKKSPQLELNAISNALQSGFILPSSGGDAVRNPKAVPTGRNMYSIDAETTPTKVAWELGDRMAKELLAKHIEKHKNYPQKVAFTLWGGEFIRGEGASIAQIFYMLGVKPVWSSNGKVKGVKLIPISELGRPRIDVLVQTSGQFRDFASSRIFLINKAVKMAANDPDSDETNNFVKKGVLQLEKDLKKEGFTPEEAQVFSTARVFGGVNGNFGTAIMGMVENGDSWEKDSEIADQYIKNMGAVYTEENWGTYKPGLFQAGLNNTEMVVQPRSSNTWGALSLDHVYEFTGGLSNAIRNTTGKDPDAYFVDMRSHQNAYVQSIDEAIWVEAQSTLFNPKYIEELAKGSASSAEVFAETTRDLYGWNVMKPDAIDGEMWDKMHKVYVQDEYNIGVKDFFERENPYALQEVTAVMLETARKGYWKPDAKVIKEIAELHAKLVKDHDAGCSGFVCDNAKLKNFISENISAEVKEAYQNKISSVREVSSQQQKKNIALKKVEKEKTLQELIADNKTISYLVLGLFAFFIFAFLYGRRRRK